MTNFFKKYQTIIIFGFLVFLISFLTGWVWLNIYSTGFYKIPELNSGSFELQQQYELALVYIGSSTCGPSNHDDLPPAFLQIKNLLEEKAGEYEYSFKTIGIAREIQITDGLTHLAGYGSFDEIIVGNNWSNLGIDRYVYNNIAGEAATPQVLVTRRNFRAPALANSTVYRGIDSEILLIRKVGFQEIIDWAAMGAILPSDSFIFEKK